MVLKEIKNLEVFTLLDMFFFLFMAFCSGCGLGISSGVNAVRQEAINANVAEFKVDDKGNVTFHFKGE